MEFNWNVFKGEYPNEQDARIAFAKLCEELMCKKFPEFIIKNSDTIKEDNNKIDPKLDKKCKIYLSKFFLDGVSNSRKGQIRKSLNDNLPYMKANKITEWYLLMPLEFSPEEKNWWENWSLRIKQENGITPIVILSEKLVDMVADLDYDFKGTELIPKRNRMSGFQIAGSKTEDTGMLDIVIDEPVAATIVDKKAEETAESVIAVADEALDKTIAVVAAAINPNLNTEEPAVEIESADPETTASTSASINKGGKTIDKPSQPKEEMAAAAIGNIIETADPKTTDAEPENTDAEKQPKKKSTIAEPTLNQLTKSWNYKQKFEALEAEKLALPTDKDNNQREVFDNRRQASSVKNYLNDFVFGDMTKFKGKELLKKAQIYVTNTQYSRGLYIYEYANAKQLLDDPKLKADYEQGVKEADFNLHYKYHMILGDLYFAKRDYINASESYQKAMDAIQDWEENLSKSTSLETNIYSSRIRDNEAEIKHLEAKAESMLQVGEFANAIANFKAALELAPDNEQLQKRLEIAELLEKSNYFKHPLLRWLNIFIAPFLYYRARRIDPNIRVLKDAEKLRNRAIWGLLVMALIIALLVWLYLKLTEKHTDVDPEYDNRTEVMASTTPMEMHQSLGDKYMSMISPEAPHYIDSAIAAYERALRFNSTDAAAEAGYAKAMNEKNTYLQMVQQNIDTDSATYFLSMRRPTEGLRLFKYKYNPDDPEKGKFGYVDTLGRVKIAPVFDFNYRKMDCAGETFYNGRALVCLKVAEGDTIYFYIDQRGNRIEE